MCQGLFAVYLSDASWQKSVDGQARDAAKGYSLGKDRNAAAGAGKDRFAPID
ncbi:MAG TPA: hypothetical protein PKC23_02620 [Candidatus Desulfobacillus sp.]|nr:hypothetical protein [Candidatus Desulfobacillus sp.]